jgi:L-lactate dehydrogenase complex protein LldG
MRALSRRARSANSGAAKKRKRQRDKGLVESGKNSPRRREILAAIRRQLAASSPSDVVYNEHLAHHEVPAQVRQQIADSHKPNLSPVERFQQSLEVVSGHCSIARDEDEAAEAVRQILELKQARSIAISDSPLVRRIIERVKPDAVLVENATPSQLFDCDIGITSAQWVIAETGTLVLESNEERHRLASLVPPVHIAIIEANRIRQTLAEVLSALSEKGQDGLSRAITFITGPSRTSDIELTLAIGVHGPGEVYVVIIEGSGYDG